MPAAHVPPAQDFPQPPQFRGSVPIATSHPSAGFWLQSRKPIVQVKLHVPTTHDGFAFGGVGQAAQVGPHAAGSLSGTQRPAHVRSPARQVNPQWPSVHVVSASATAGQGRPQLPQWLTLASGLTHSVPQRSGAVGVQPLSQRNASPDGAQTGEAAGHAVLQLPQVAAFERSTSQPSSGAPLQSAWPLSHVFTAQPLVVHAAVP